MAELSFEKRVTLGFKLMAGYYSGEISRDSIERLATNDTIHWGSTELEDSANRMISTVLQDDVFKFWQSWHSSIMEQTSDAVAINFVLLLLKDWERKGRPINPSAAQTKLFHKNARILLDRSVYEYVTKQWRGSSDSRIASNLAALPAQGPLLDRVADERWASLIHDVLELGSIEGRSYLLSVDRSIKLLLLYMYVCTDVDGPTEPDSSYDVDHIIPQSAFEASGDPTLEPFKNHMANLALLPHRQNMNKSNRPLRDLTEPWLKRQVVKYEGIQETEFSNYSSIQDFAALRETRSQRILEALTTVRSSRLA